MMKYAVCNELFTDLSLEEACRLTAELGFQGIELAPYTLAVDPTELRRPQIRKIRRTIEAAGLACVGLHWLLKAPPGLHLTTPDAAVRTRSWDVLRFLVDLCGELAGEILVLGSGKQRDARGIPRETACGFLQEGLAGLVPAAEQARVRILLEALPSAVTNAVNTLADAQAILDAIGSPAISGIFDFHNTKDEVAPWDQLIAHHAAMIAHVHLNEVDGYHPSLVDRPGRSRSDFSSVFRALAERSYAGWVSLEIFHADLPPEAILAETHAFLDHPGQRVIA
jgi:D-psicose/D-tagatose/L-ribulose 3-epimerase